MLNVKILPKDKKRLEYDDKIASEQLVASSAVTENKTIDFDNSSSRNSSIMVAGLSSPELVMWIFLMTLISVQAQIRIHV